MKKYKLLLIIMLLIFSFVFVLGCIGGKEPPPPPPTHVTPCNVIGEGVRIKVMGSKLDLVNVKKPLAESFVDNIVSVSETVAYRTYTVSCWWAKKVGETQGLYYCQGSYKAPELDEKGTINRHLKKDFKIGFEVEKHSEETWVDLSGVIHKETPYYLLTTKSISAECSIA